MSRHIPKIETVHGKFTRDISVQIKKFKLTPKISAKIWFSSGIPWVGEAYFRREDVFSPRNLAVQSHLISCRLQIAYLILEKYRPLN